MVAVAEQRFGNKGLKQETMVSDRCAPNSYDACRTDVQSLSGVHRVQTGVDETAVSRSPIEGKSRGSTTKCSLFSDAKYESASVAVTDQRARQNWTLFPEAEVQSRSLLTWMVPGERLPFWSLALVAERTSPRQVMPWQSSAVRTLGEVGL